MGEGTNGVSCHSETCNTARCVAELNMFLFCFEVLFMKHSTYSQQQPEPLCIPVVVQLYSLQPFCYFHILHTDKLSTCMTDVCSYYCCTYVPAVNYFTTDSHCSDTFDTL